MNDQPHDYFEQPADDWRPLSREEERNVWVGIVGAFAVWTLFCFSMGYLLGVYL